MCIPRIKIRQILQATVIMYNNVNSNLNVRLTHVDVLLAKISVLFTVLYSYFSIQLTLCEMKNAINDLLKI